MPDGKAEDMGADEAWKRMYLMQARKKKFY
jgi:hypothetical protein